MKHFEVSRSTEEIFSGKVFRVTVEQVTLENGKNATRELVHHNGGACVAAVTPEKEVYLVRQFRYAFGEELWELPAGKLDLGEDAFVAAQRELKEETGFVAKQYFDLGIVYPTVGFCTEKIYTWLATGLEMEQQCLDEDEFLSVEKMPLDKAVQLVLDGKIRDSKTAVTLLKIDCLLKQGKIALE